MTLITTNEILTKEDIIKFLEEYNLIKEGYIDIKIDSDYFKELSYGTYSLNIDLIYDNGYVENYDYKLTYLEKEQISIKNNTGYFVLTSIILLLILFTYLTIFMIKKHLKKRNNNLEIDGDI